MTASAPPPSDGWHPLLRLAERGCSAIGENVEEWCKPLVVDQEVTDRSEAAVAGVWAIGGLLGQVVAHLARLQELVPTEEHPAPTGGEPANRDRGRRAALAVLVVADDGLPGAALLDELRAAGFTESEATLYRWIADWKVPGRQLYVHPDRRKRWTLGEG